jgi:hypothetical protein
LERTAYVDVLQEELGNRRLSGTIVQAMPNHTFRRGLPKDWRGFPLREPPTVEWQHQRKAAAIPTHRSSLLAQEAGMAELRGGSGPMILAVDYCPLT